MEDEGGVGDEGLVAASEGARNVLGTVCRGVEVRIEIASRVEVPLTRRTIIMSVGLSIMLFQTVLVLEDLAASHAIIVVVDAVIQKLSVTRKMLVAALTIMVVRTLHPVLLESCPGRKVESALMTNVVILGIPFVLNEGRLGGKVAAAARAFDHREMLV